MQDFKTIVDGVKTRRCALMDESLELLAGAVLPLGNQVKRIYAQAVTDVSSPSKITLSAAFDGEFQVVSLGKSLRGIIVESKVSQMIYYNGSLNSSHEVSAGATSFSIVYIEEADAFFINSIDEKDYEIEQSNIIEGIPYQFFVPPPFHNSKLTVFEPDNFGFFRANYTYIINAFNGNMITITFAEPHTSVKLKFEK